MVVGRGQRLRSCRDVWNCGRVRGRRSSEHVNGISTSRLLPNVGCGGMSVVGAYGGLRKRTRPQWSRRRQACPRQGQAAERRSDFEKSSSANHEPVRGACQRRVSRRIRRWLAASAARPRPLWVRRRRAPVHQPARSAGFASDGTRAALGRVKKPAVRNSQCQPENRHRRLGSAA